MSSQMELPNIRKKFVSVKVTHLVKSVTPEFLQREVQHIPFLKIKVNETTLPYNYAYINCPTVEASEQVISYLNGRSINGATVQAHLHTKPESSFLANPKGLTKEQQMSNDDRFFMERFEREITKAKGKGHTLDFKDEILLVGGPNDLIDSFFDNYVS